MQWGITAPPTFGRVLCFPQLLWRASFCPQIQFCMRLGQHAFHTLRPIVHRPCPITPYPVPLLLETAPTSGWVWDVHQARSPPVPSLVNERADQSGIIGQTQLSISTVLWPSHHHWWPGRATIVRQIFLWAVQQLC